MFDPARLHHHRKWDGPESTDGKCEGGNDWPSRDSDYRSGDPSPWYSDGGAGSPSHWGPSREAPPGDGSDSSPPLTGDITQDKSTLTQMANDPTTSGAALRAFAKGVAGEAVDAGDLKNAQWAINLAAGLGKGGPVSFPNGDENSFNSDMKAAKDFVTNAHLKIVEAEADPFGKYELLKEAESDFKAAAKSAQKAETEASNNNEKINAIASQGASDVQDASTIWLDGQAGPGHEQSGEYNLLMDTAKEKYNSIANNPAASSDNKRNAVELSNDINTMKIATGTGNSGKSKDYADAIEDFKNRDSSMEASPAPADGTPPPSKPSVDIAVPDPTDPSSASDATGIPPASIPPASIPPTSDAGGTNTSQYPAPSLN